MNIQIANRLTLTLSNRRCNSAFSHYRYIQSKKLLKKKEAQTKT